MSYDPDLLNRHLAEAEAAFPGADYYQVLRWIHDILKPHSYIEIGIRNGDSLSLAHDETLCVGIDPAPSLTATTHPNTRIFEMTSDDFFAYEDLAAILGAPEFSLAFIDGLHLWDQALKDFVNLERFAGPGSVIVIHDAVPLNEATSSRERTTAFYSGDVWKLPVYLKEQRPDLRLVNVRTAPTGLCIVTGFNPASPAPDPEVTRHYMALPFSDLRSIDTVENTREALEAWFASAPVGGNSPGPGYRFAAGRRVWVRDRSEAYCYSDGDAVEDRLLEIISSASDVRNGSTELAAHITDWPSLYHLSPARSNLLRPIAHLLRGSVLEVGPGCGALTRYLGENGADVTAVEGSIRRASITASRCRDLPAVKVVCDTFERFQPDGLFDCVLLVGVLEYSRVVTGDAEAPQRMIARCRQMLTPSGCLVVAIENQLGLKYFCGAPEDHTGAPYYGVKDLYSTDSPVTWGRCELLDLLRDAFPHVTELLPFPDYKLPRLVTTAGALYHDPLLAADLLAQFGPAAHEPLPYERSFSEAGAWSVVLRNRLVAEMSNSFLFIAAAEPKQPEAPLAVYSANRRRCFQRGTLFEPEANGWNIRHVALHQGEALYEHEGFSQHLAPHRYCRGHSFANICRRVLRQPEWSIGALASALEPYVELLQSFIEEDGQLNGRYLDCVPQNIVVDESRGLSVFDLEWVAKAKLPLGYVLFRGLLSLLSGPVAASASLNVPSMSLAVLVSQLMNRFGVPFGDSELSDYLDCETEFQTFATGVERRLTREQWQGLELHAEATCHRDRVTASLRKTEEELQQANQRISSLALEVISARTALREQEKPTR